MSIVSGKAPPPPPPPALGKAGPPLPKTGPPLPKSGPPPLPKAMSAASTGVPLTSGLVGVHVWKSGSGREYLPSWLREGAVLPALGSEDAFLRPLWDAGHTSSMTTRGLEDQTIVAVPQDTLFRVEEFFKKKVNTVVETASAKRKGVSVLEPERQKLVSLALGGALKKKEYNQVMEAVEKGDEKILNSGLISSLLQLMSTISMDEFKLVKSTYGSSSGGMCSSGGSSSTGTGQKENIEECDKFIYALTKVEKIKEKLECINQKQNYSEQMNLCEVNLSILNEATQIVQTNLPKIRNLSNTALIVGNRFTRAVLSSVSLNSVLRLSEVKSTLDPRLDLLHFVVALMTETPMFTDAEIAVLRKAAVVRTHRVRDEVKDLLDGIQMIRKFVNNEPSVQPELRTKLYKFLSDIDDRVSDLTKNALQIFANIKLIAAALDDFKTLYPPPREKTADTVDLFEALANLASAVRLREKDARTVKMKIFDKSNFSSPVKAHTSSAKDVAGDAGQGELRRLSGIVFTHVRTQNLPLAVSPAKITTSPVPFASPPVPLLAATTAVSRLFGSPPALAVAVAASDFEVRPPPDLPSPFTPPGGFREIMNARPSREVVLPSSRPATPEHSLPEFPPESASEPVAMRAPVLASVAPPTVAVPRLSLTSMRTSDVILSPLQLERQASEAGRRNSARGYPGSSSSARGTLSARGQPATSARGRPAAPVIGRDTDGIDGFLRRVEASESSKSLARTSSAHADKRSSTGSRLSLSTALTSAHRALRNREQMHEPGILLTPVKDNAPDNVDQNAKVNKPYIFSSTKHFRN